MEKSARIFKRVATDLQKKIRFTDADTVKIGPYGEMSQCAFYFVPSTFTERSETPNGQDKRAIPPELILVGKISVDALSKSIVSGKDPIALSDQPVTRKINQKELPPGVSYEFYDKGGRRHGDRLYTPILLATTWGEANTFCQKLKFSGVSGWRLPTRAELWDFATKPEEGRSAYREMLDNPFGISQMNGTHIWTSTNGTSSNQHVMVKNSAEGKFTSSGDRADKDSASVACTR